MASALLGIPLMDRHVTARAFAVLFQHAMPQRMADRAAVNLIKAEQPGAFIADAAPGRFPADVDFAIRTIGRYVAVFITVEALHFPVSGFHIFAPLTVTVKADF
jgi:hypothetical protein